MRGDITKTIKKHKLNHGFTIIEIILVLAVARLIFQ